MRWRSLSRAIEGSTLAMSFKTLTPIIIGFIFASFYLTANVSAQVTNFCSAPCGQTSTTCTDQLLDPDLAAGCPQEQKEVWIECPLYPPPDCVSGLRWVNVAKEGCPTSERVPCIQQICCTPCNAGDCGTALPTPTAAVTTTPPPGSTPTAAPTGAAGVPAPSGSPSPGCTEGGPYISAWSVCSASPAKKSRTVGYDCYTGYVQTVDCMGAIQAKGVVVSPSDTSCSAVASSTTGITGAVHQFTAGSASQPTPQTQSGNNYVSFSPIVGGSYTIASTAPSDYTLTRACWSKSLNAPLSGEGLSTTLSVPTDGDTLAWQLGYTFSGPWVQTGGGGNVYGAGALTSKIPGTVSPRAFVLDGSGGTPGLVTYGTSYDFDSDPLLTGESYVSSTNWLANDSHSVINYYDLLYRRFGGMTTADSFADLAAVTKPVSRATPYYVVGDMTTSGDWAIADGETVIFIVNGNLTLGGKINLTGSGFAAFIVNGNITVASAVGGLYSSSAPAIEGIYVTSPSGTFSTSTSSVSGKERLVGQGIFVAGSFLLQRDLESITQNNTTSAELFLYNPRLLISMPDSMRDVPITWEEVAP